MRVVIDTNVIISALIRDSITREVIVKSGWQLFYPEIVLHEIRKHKETILKKSGLSEKDHDDILGRLLKYITLIPAEQCELHLEEARKEIEKRDPCDVIFLAAALSLENSVIWSDDKDFEIQSKIKILKTKDIMDLFSAE